MYGVINDAFRRHVQEQYGDQIWRQVDDDTNLTEAAYIRMRQQDDASTYQLVGSTVAHTGLSAEEVLRAFGEFWIESVARKQYAGIMRKMGDDLVEFVGNLDEMHSSVSSTFLRYTPPSFEVQEGEDDVVLFVYNSFRKGLTPFVEGLLYGLSKYFSQEIEIQRIIADESAEGERTTFVVRVAPPAKLPGDR